MELKKTIKNLLNQALGSFGQQIVSSSLLYEWQMAAQDGSSFNIVDLPEETNRYLQSSNPRLIELKQRYSQLDRDVTEAEVWKEGYVTSTDMKYFRGDNAYVWQLRGANMNPMGYALTTYYVKSIDHLGLLSKLAEDKHFGVHSFEVDNRLVSRDLLDSIIEMYFLEKHLNISGLDRVNMLDIGSGYGRLAHRMVSGFPNIDRYLCTDAIPVSTFICEYYLRFRNVDNKAKVIPLYDIENVLKNRTIDIAINVHSFSECRVQAIAWWLNLLKQCRVKYLMIVPNAVDDEGRLLTNDGQDFSSIVEGYGYKLVAKEPKYRDIAVQRFAINPAYHYLFELESP